MEINPVYVAAIRERLQTPLRVNDEPASAKENGTLAYLKLGAISSDLSDAEPS